MSPLTDTSSSEIDPPPHSEEPRRDEQNTGISPMVGETNHFLVLWLRVIACDNRLPSEALAVARVLARSVGIGRVAFTDWQRINAALGRNRRDLEVFETMSELELEGYLGRDVENRFVYGWTLLIPKEEQ